MTYKQRLTIAANRAIKSNHEQFPYGQTAWAQAVAYALRNRG
jgi:hypothetical protein